MVERFNRVVLNFLRKSVQAESNWDLYCPLLLLHYRACPHAATGFSPAKLVFGREIRTPLDVIAPPALTLAEELPTDYVARLEEHLEKASEAARRHLDSQWDKMARTRPGSKGLPPILPGVLVRVFSPAIRLGYLRKFTPMWAGPYRVQEVIDPLRYRIKFPGPRGLRVIHRDRLWPIPTW